MNFIFQTLLNTCNNLVNHDLFMHLKTLTSVAGHGVVSRGNKCRLCNKQFSTLLENEEVICFRFLINI